MKTWVLFKKPLHYALYFYLGIILIVLFGVGLTAFLGTQSPIIIYIGFLFTLLCLLLLAFQLGFRMHEASLIFIEDQAHHLYVLDIRQSSPLHQKHLMEQARDLKKYLASIENNQTIPLQARRIKSRGHLYEHHKAWICRCRDERNQPFTLIIGKDLEDLDSLWLALQRIPPDPQASSHSHILSLILLGGSLSCSLVLTILSHPAIAILDPQPYFLFLTMTGGLGCCLIYLIVKAHRHE